MLLFPVPPTRPSKPRAGADGRFLASAISRRDSLPARLGRGYTLRPCTVLPADGDEPSTPTSPFGKSQTPKNRGLRQPAESSGFGSSLVADSVSEGGAADVWPSAPDTPPAGRPASRTLCPPFMRWPRGSFPPHRRAGFQRSPRSWRSSRSSRRRRNIWFRKGE